jgi:hypothetical protein
MCMGSLLFYPPSPVLQGPEPMPVSLSKKEKKLRTATIHGVEPLLLGPPVPFAVLSTMDRCCLRDEPFFLEQECFQGLQN